jgi:hypothetical protein
MSKLIYYVEFLAAFFAAQMTSMWGQYFTLKFPKMGMVEAFLRAIPFAWVDWFFMSIAVGLGDKHKLVTPTQDTFLLIIIQFCTILLINKFYLKQPLSRSDIVTFFIILIGFYVSSGEVVSRVLGKQHSAKNTVHKKVVKHLDEKAMHVVPGTKTPTKE